MPQSPLREPLTTPKLYHACATVRMIQQRNPANVNHKPHNGSKRCFSTRCFKSHLVDTKHSSSSKKKEKKTLAHFRYPVEAAGEEKTVLKLRNGKRLHRELLSSECALRACDSPLLLLTVAWIVFFFPYPTDVLAFDSSWGILLSSWGWTV